MIGLKQQTAANESFVEESSFSSQTINNSSAAPISCPSSDYLENVLNRELDSIDDLKRIMSFSIVIDNVINRLKFKAIEESEITKKTGIERTEITKAETEEEESLLSLLSEPVGDWEEERNVIHTGRD